MIPGATGRCPTTHSLRGRPPQQPRGTHVTHAAGTSSGHTSCVTTCALIRGSGPSRVALVASASHDRIPCMCTNVYTPGSDPTCAASATSASRRRRTCACTCARAPKSAPMRVAHAASASRAFLLCTTMYACVHALQGTPRRMWRVQQAIRTGRQSARTRAQAHPRNRIVGLCSGTSEKQRRRQPSGKCAACAQHMIAWPIFEL